MSQWETIGSAPRDGTPILIRQGSAIATALWRPAYKHKWVIPTDDGWLECTWIIPTHWSPIPEPLEQAQQSDAQSRLFYYTTDPDGVWHGRCRSREEAISEGRVEHPGEDFFVTWAINEPIRLADWIEADRILEQADETLADSDRVCLEYDDQPHFEVTPEQERDLIARVQRACDEWQTAHKLVFTVNTFSAMGEPELIKAEGEAST